MSKKICRTCLKMTYKTYKTHENIHYPGEKEQMKISDMLKYLIPELYLGVTVNPEICDECKLILRSAYAFRKKCLATENVIGSYLKKSRCNAASIELIDVIVYLEESKKVELQDQIQNEKVQANSQVKAQEIISEWDDDASQDSDKLHNLAGKENSQPQPEKELTLSPELGVFVDKFGNCYNADGVSINHPEAIVNTQTDFLKITEVFSLNEDADVPPANCSNIEKAKPPDEQVEVGNKIPRITIIPEARISHISEAKTDLIKPRPVVVSEVKNNVITPRIMVLPEAKSDAKLPPLSLIPEKESTPPLNDTIEPLMPIIVDVRSENETTELSSPYVVSDSHSEKAASISDAKSDIKEEPLDPDKHDDDEDTLTASETSSYDKIQGIIDNIPETYNNSYVDIPEFVHINNFSLKDLDELRQKQNVQGGSTIPILGMNTQVRSVKNVSEGGKPMLKSLIKILPKPDPTQYQSDGSQQIDLEIIPNKKRKVSLREVGTLPTRTASQETFSSSISQVAGQIVRKLSPKKCIVPRCPNSTALNSKKLFVLFPKKESRREQWFKAVRVQPIDAQDVYICEDHFDLSNDMENWMHFKVFGSRMRMKEDVIPHRFIDVPIPDEMVNTSQLNDADRKRRADQLDQLRKMKVQRLDELDESATPEIPKEDGLCLVTANIKVDTNNEKLVPRIIRKRRRKVKIVPVDDQFATIERSDKFDRDDVCVLFTNYTSDGFYVNDHDYLVTPYKRNKILINENDQWLCMCFICGLKHPVDQHVEHMNVHLSTCKMCKTNLGTPYMLNMHVRFHTKKCAYCTQKVIYGDFAKHELMHMEEDAEFEKEKQKRTRWRGKKKIVDKDEKPVYYPIKLGSDSDKEDHTDSSITRRLRTTPIKPTEDVKKDIEKDVKNIIEPLPDITETLAKVTDPVYAEQAVSVVNIEEKTDSSMLSSNITDKVPESTESVEDNTKSELDSTEIKKIKQEIDVKDESTLSDMKGETKKKRKCRSREVEPVKVEDDSPRVLRSRQKKD